jgi:hypothetical protein
MSFRAGLTAFLGSQPAVNELVDGRIHPIRLPDKPTLPAIVYLVVNNGTRFTHDGALPLRHPLIQLDVWSHRVEEAERLSDAVTQALNGYRGPMGDVDYTAGWFMENSTDLYEQDTNLHRISMDFRGWYAQEGE